MWPAPPRAARNGSRRRRTAFEQGVHGVDQLVHVVAAPDQLQADLSQLEEGQLGAGVRRLATRAPAPTIVGNRPLEGDHLRQAREALVACLSLIEVGEEEVETVTRLARLGVQASTLRSCIGLGLEQPLDRRRVLADDRRAER